MSSKLSHIMEGLSQMLKNNFGCFTFNTGVEQFGGDVSRFVNFYADNVQVLLDVASCGDFPPFEVVDRFMSFVSCSCDMDEETFMMVKQDFRKHGFTIVSSSRDDDFGYMYARLVSDSGCEKSIVHVSTQLDVHHPDSMKTVITIRFHEGQFGGRFEGFGALSVKVSYVDKNPLVIDSLNGSQQRMVVEWEGAEL